MSNTLNEAGAGFLAALNFYSAIATKDNANYNKPIAKCRAWTALAEEVKRGLWPAFEREMGK